MFSSSRPEDLLGQVNNFWSMLDDLSENDPEAYQKFIKKQMKAGAEFIAPPELHSCLRTQRVGPDERPVYINICSWKRVPAPQDPSRPLPVWAGKLETDTNEDCFTVLDVAFNPGALQDRKAELYALALSFAQQHFGITLSQQYTVVSCSPKSSPDDLYRRLGFQQRPAAPKQPDTVSQTPGDLLQKISSETQDDDTAAQGICRPAMPKKEGLIEVISSTFVPPQKPEYQLEMKTDASGAPHSLELTVELPKVCSVSDCQLKVSKADVLLEVEDVYYLLLEFPTAVNEDTASAIFNKTKRRLTLRVDVV